MIGKEKIKYIRSLHQRKFRQKYHKFIAEGPKIVEECLAYAPDRIEAIYALPTYIQTLENQDPILKEKLIEIDEKSLAKISALDTPAQVLVLMNSDGAQPTHTRGNMILLDGIQNPNNMGAILRIADWYGISTVLCGKGTVDRHHPKMIQASMGSFLRVDRIDIEISEIKSTFPKHQIVVADLGGERLSDFSFLNPAILVLGSEGSGPSKEIKAIADATLTISRPSARTTPESLNVSVAAGIICERWRGN